MKTPIKEQKQTLRLRKVTIARLNHLQMSAVRVGLRDEPPQNPVVHTDACTDHCTDLSECCPTQTTGDTGITPNSIGEAPGGTTGG